MIGVVADFNNNTMTLYRNGALYGTRPSVFISGQAYFPAVQVAGSNQATVNFGATAFKYTQPSGTSLWTH